MPHNGAARSIAAREQRPVRRRLSQRVRSARPDDRLRVIRQISNAGVTDYALLVSRDHRLMYGWGLNQETLA